MFALLPDVPATQVAVYIEGTAVMVPKGVSAAAAMLMASDAATRTTPVSGEPRAPYCMMGVCFECLMEIDGQPNQQGCLVIVEEGMRIRRQHGKREVAV
jgi:predicted molibdopterin-dependent oxidoreductase YjgC